MLKIVIALAFLVFATGARAVDLRSYRGTSVSGVDVSTLNGKVMCGYQGWFTTDNDGAKIKWWHYGKKGGFEPGNCGFDLWPDLTGFDADERFDTGFKNIDGSPAQLFSSENAKTVDRHFAWMQQYGIDGVFVQRFATDTFGPATLSHLNHVLDHCRAGANQHGRAYAVMYDLSGLQAGQMNRVMDDWKSLVDQMKLTRDPNDKAYIHHNGRPVVAVWGIGFNDKRKYTLDECAKLIRFLKSDPTYGGCIVMVGVPTYWRTLDHDCVKDSKLLDVIQLADIVSPWTVGRYNSPESATQYAQQRMAADVVWCKSHKQDFMPVVFPGFSWHNLNPASKSDEIPRLKGKFLWTQYVQDKRAGATMIYQAMFDEINEGTAIFMCTNTPPVGGGSVFLRNEGLPSDYYLWLAGEGAKLMSGSGQASSEMPVRK